MKLSTIKDIAIIGLVLFLFYKVKTFFFPSEEEKQKFLDDMENIHDWKDIRDKNEAAFQSSADYIKKNGLVAYIKAYIKGEL